jgi:arsenate reductase
MTNSMRDDYRRNDMSDKIVVYQKPTCSKCRATLALLKDSGAEFDAVNYYETPLSADNLRELIRKLDVPVRDVLRADEPLAQALKLAERDLSDDELISLMVENPDLIQRPIVVRGDEAVLCRPPQEVMKLL